MYYEITVDKISSLICEFSHYKLVTPIQTSARLLREVGVVTLRAQHVE